MILLTFTKAGQDDIVLTEDDLFDFEYEENAYSGEAFELGGVCAKSIYILIDNNTQRFSRGTFANCRVRLDIDGNFYGYFNSELPKRRNGVIELNAYDDMVKLDVEFPTDYIFPQTFWSVYAQCVFEAGIAESISFDNVILNGVWDNGIISADYTDYIYANSCRNLVSGMAEWNGGFARINNDGKLQVDKFSKTVSREFNSDELMELDYSDETVVFSNVKTSQKNKTYEKGDDSGYTLVLNNQYISYGLDDEAFEVYLTLIYEYYCGFSLTPMSFTLAEPDFRLHVGDRVQVFDEEEQVTITGNVSKIEITGNCSMRVTCGGFENIASTTNFTPTSYSQISQSKTEAAKSGAYISAKVANAQAVDYDSIERGVLSVDFSVDGTDSDVVFCANQLCDVSSAGTLSCIYKVDGATQDFNPAQTLTAGRRIFPHIFAMPLGNGKHNFSVYILSEDGGRGTTDIGWLNGAISGQISGIKNNAPSNENLIMYLSGVPEGTEVTLPAYMYANKSAKKYVDWGDGSEVEESTDYVAISHNYAAGDFIITIKSGNVSFGGTSMTTGTNFAEYLTRVYFPDGAADISWGNASKYFTVLEAVTFGTSAATVKWDFTNSTLITSIIIPDTVTTLTLANINKTAITALFIPEKVTSALSLGACASLITLEAYGSGTVGAQKSTNLQRLTIGKNMASIGTNGYDGCTNLSEVVFLTPSKLTSIGNAAFRNCAFADVDLPSTVETIGESAFSGCSGITSIVLPEKLTTLGKSAFSSCTGLTSVSVGSALTKILDTAFSGCISLDTINFPDGLLSIGTSAFYNTGAISPEFPSSLVTINTKAFQKSGITAAVLRANMTVGTYAFSESGLAELTIENGFAAIPSNCFYSTTSLESVSIPGSVTDIGGSAFYQSGLKTLHLSEGLETIGASAFRGSKLTSVTLPASVTDVGNYAFNSCSSLTGVTIKGNTTLGTQAFSSCGSLASVDMGNTANIPGYCFNGCANLNSVSFAPDTVVGNSAFSGCGFTSLSLGHFHIISTLTDAGGMYSLGSGAFANCSNLATVDGLKYKWDVGLKTRTSYIDGDGNRQWHDWEDKGCVEQGIYDSMGATTDSVFSGTKLYNYTEYLKNNGLVNTDDIQYSVYHYTGRNPAYAT